MMYKIAINPSKGNPSDKGRMGHIETHTLSDYDNLCHEKWLEGMIASIRSGNDSLKKDLPFRSPHYYAFRDNHRSQADLLPECFLFQTCVDVDDASMVAKAIEGAKALDAKPGQWRGKLLHMEYSSRKKLHIDIRLPLGMTIEEAQRDYCRNLDIPFDKSCITPERMIYITPATEEIYRSEQWYAVMPDDDLKMYRDALTDRGLTIDGRPRLLSLDAHDEAEGQKQSINPELTVKNSDSQQQPPTEAELRIFDEAVKEAGLTVADLNTKGSRHNSVVAILSVGICRLLSQERLMAALKFRMPRAEDKNIRQVVSDFYTKYTDPNRPMSERLRRIYADSFKQGVGTAPAVDGNSTDNDVAADKIQRIKDFKRCLPMGLKESCQGVPDNMVMPVLCALLPLAAAYADGVELKYSTGQRMRLNLMSIIVGPQASGKSVCMDAINEWRKAMDDEDQAGWAAEEEWRDGENTRRDKDKGKTRPKQMVRDLPPNISVDSFMHFCKISGGHTLYSVSEELDTLVKSNRSGAWAELTDVYRLGFDNGEWGRIFSSTHSEPGKVTIHYNWTMLGTYGALYRFFTPTNIENGLSSRIMVAEMPDTLFSRMPVIKERTEKQNKVIKDAIAVLRSKHGFYDTPKLRKAMEQWVEKVRLETAASYDSVRAIYRKRAAVMGMRCGMIAFLLSDEKETKKVLEFARGMADYILDEQCSVFSEKMGKVVSESDYVVRRKSRNKTVFNLLPDSFKREDVISLRPDAKDFTIRKMISVWKNTGLVVKKDNDTWQKVANGENG